MWIVDPKRVRHFAQSAGQLAKNDRIDARMIAWFGETFADGIGRRPMLRARNSTGWSCAPPICCDLKTR